MAMRWPTRQSPAATVAAPGDAGLDSGITHGLLGQNELATATTDEVPADFQQDVALALWESGVDVSQVQTMLPQLVKSLWQDPFLQNMYQSAFEGATTTDPLTGAYISNFTPYIKKELFDPQQTHQMPLVAQGTQMLLMSGKQLTSAQQNFAANLGGGSPEVMSALAKAAQETGVPYNVALAVAMAESGLNPKAIGDNGDSVGLFQLNIHGEGAGMTVEQREDPYQNALIALREFAAVAAQDPTLTSDPGRWAAAAQRPADPNLYATRVNNLLQSGFGGSPSSIVPKPFDGNYPVTETHAEGDPGVDYGTPVGTSIYTPFAGTILLEDGGQTNWGYRARVVLDNGYTFGVGHLTSFAVADGQRVNPGDLLGLSGGATDDPHGGHTFGPHVELQWISPGGNFLDPTTLIDSIMSGTATFRSLNLTGAEGGGVSATAARNRALGIDPILEAQYPSAVSAYEKYMGRHPTAQELQAVIAATGGDPTKIEQWFKSRPSQVPGMSIGMYQDVKGNLDSAAQQLYGHAVTDGMVKEAFDQGKTDPTSAKFYLEQMSIAGKMPKDIYAAYVAANAPHMAAVYNQPGAFDPRIAYAQHAIAKEQGVTPPPPQLRPGPLAPWEKRAFGQQTPGGDYSLQQ